MAAFLSQSEKLSEIKPPLIITAFSVSGMILLEVTATNCCVLTGISSTRPQLRPLKGRRCLLRSLCAKPSSEQSLLACGVPILSFVKHQLGFTHFFYFLPLIQNISISHKQLKRGTEIYILYSIWGLNTRKSNAITYLSKVNF